MKVCLSTKLTLSDCQSCQSFYVSNVSYKSYTFLWYVKKEKYLGAQTKCSENRYTTVQKDLKYPLKCMKTNDVHLWKTNIEIKLNHRTIKETTTAGQFIYFLSRCALLKHIFDSYDSFILYFQVLTALTWMFWRNYNFIKNSLIHVFISSLNDGNLNTSSNHPELFSHTKIVRKIN